MQSTLMPPMVYEKGAKAGKANFAVRDWPWISTDGIVGKKWMVELERFELSTP